MLKRESLTYDVREVGRSNKFTRVLVRLATGGPRPPWQRDVVNGVYTYAATRIF